MTPELTPSLQNFLADWAITIAIGGAVCSIIGLFAGWIIWRNTRRFTEKVEKENRDALSEYEKTSDEISRMKAELAGSE